MKHSVTWIQWMSSAILCFAFLSSCYALPNAEPIKIGMSTALSGPAQSLGKEMKLGIDIYFAKINAASGINGQPLKLIALDDKYEPELAAANMRALIDKDNVLAVIGNVGTPTAVVSIPIVNEKHVLLFAPFTGAGILRNTPPDRYIINMRASYAEETAAMIKGLLSIGIKPSEIAFFTQNDAYGDSGYAGSIKVLKAAGYADADLLPHGTYPRNTLNVEAGLAQILKARQDTKAIIIVGAYAPVARFIKLAKKDLPHTLFLNVSFVGSKPLAEQLNNSEVNDAVIVTQVIPSFDDEKLVAVREYREDLKKYANNSSPSFGSLEGYLAAKVFVMGLQKAAIEKKLTREGIIDAIESLHDVDIGIGEKISFDKNQHQALHVIWPTILKNGHFVPFQWTDLAQHKGK